jgi:hypothetical protein
VLDADKVLVFTTTNYQQAYTLKIGLKLVQEKCNGRWQENYPHLQVSQFVLQTEWHTLCFEQLSWCTGARYICSCSLEVYRVSPTGEKLLLQKDGQRLLIFNFLCVCVSVMTHKYDKKKKKIGLDM